jgi:hypothetical protein
MRNLVCTTPFIKEVRQMRKAMVENIIDLMKKHNVNDVYFPHLNNCPVIHNGICSDDITTLNTIVLVSCDNYEYILFEGSSDFSNGVVNANDMGIELLVEVYNWIMDYEDELFEDVE